MSRQLHFYWFYRGADHYLFGRQLSVDGLLEALHQLLRSIELAVGYYSAELGDIDWVGFDEYGRAVAGDSNPYGVLYCKHGMEYLGFVPLPLLYNRIEQLIHVDFHLLHDLVELLRTDGYGML